MSAPLEQSLNLMHSLMCLLLTISASRVIDLQRVSQCKKSRDGGRYRDGGDGRDADGQMA